MAEVRAHEYQTIYGPAARLKILENINDRLPGQLTQFSLANVENDGFQRRKKCQIAKQ